MGKDLDDHSLQLVSYPSIYVGTSNMRYISQETSDFYLHSTHATYVSKGVESQSNQNNDGTKVDEYCVIKGSGFLGRGINLGCLSGCDIDNVKGGIWTIKKEEGP